MLESWMAWTWAIVMVLLWELGPVFKAWADRITYGPIDRKAEAEHELAMAKIELERERLDRGCDCEEVEASNG